MLAPLLFVAVLEAGLRLADYGHPTSFFLKQRIGGKDVLVNNDAFVLSFFPPDKARLPRPILVDAVKAPGTFRIFVMGESAAVGDPDPAYGAGRFLEVLLRERFPAARFEVINTSVTANNSHGILPIARECANYDGDFWIIYMGNNEMLGPFGAASVFGAQAPPWQVVRASVTLQRFRLGQFLMSAIRRLRPKSGGTWGGLEMFLQNRVRPEDPRKETVYRNFERNLRDILRAGLDSHTQIILNKMAVNLADCPPLDSVASSNLPPADVARCEDLYREGCKAQQDGRLNDASRLFEQAAQLDPHRADVQYQWAGCLRDAGNDALAREHFQRACDDDGLPARADSRINRLIGQAARDLASPRLVLLDAPMILSSNNPAGVCGGETFYEHVHFTFDGNYRLARAWAGEIEQRLPGDIRQRAAPAWAARDICEKELGLSDWNRVNDLAEIYHRRQKPPLSLQSNNAQQMRLLQDEIRRLKARMNNQDALAANEMFNQAIQRAPDDADLHANYADFLEACGALEPTLAQWRKVQDLLPQSAVGFFQSGRVLEHLGRLDEAREAMVQAVTLRPEMASAWVELSNIDASQRRFDAALAEIERARHLQPQQSSFYACTGKILSIMGRHGDAIDYYQQAIKIQPDYVDGHLALGTELAADGNSAAARKEFEAALQLDPNNASARTRLSELGIKN